jgi:hypothetical protein
MGQAMFTGLIRPHEVALLAALLAVVADELALTKTGSSPHRTALSYRRGASEQQGE